MSQPYISPYEAYPFLKDPSDDLRCDFELATDRLASGCGMLRALMLNTPKKTQGDGETAQLWRSLPDELLWLSEMIYHLNACLRTRFTLTEDEFRHLLDLHNRIQTCFAEQLKQFLIPAGTVAAMQAHLLRVDAKSLARLLYRWSEAGHEVDRRLLDWANLLSGFFFLAAILINHEEGAPEHTFESRNYRIQERTV